MLHGDSYYYRLNHQPPAKVRRLVLIALLVFLPFISGKGMVFSSVQTVPADHGQISTSAGRASSNTALANPNSLTLEKQKVTKPEEMPQGLYAAWKQTQEQEAVSDSVHNVGTSNNVTYQVQGSQSPLVIDPLRQGSAPLTANDGATSGTLGSAVSFSSDDNTALIGTSNKNSNQGADYIFAPLATTYACGKVPNPTADVPATITSEQSGITAINNARAIEGLGPLNLPTNFYSLSEAERVFTLFNLERSDRGLSTFSQNDPLLSRIALNHSQILVDFNVSGHNTTIDGLFADRLIQPPEINGHWSGMGEIIAYAPYSTYNVYLWLYSDASSNWGHRQNIFGCFTHAGVGYVVGGFYGATVTADFILSSSGSPYVPPTTVDAVAPTLTVNTPSFNSSASTNLDVSAVATDSGSGMWHVSFFLDANFSGTNIPTYTVNGNTYSKTFTAVAAGSHILTVVAVDKDNNYVRKDVQISDISNTNTTKTTLSSSVNPSTSGQNVTFTANVTGPGGIPSGTVTFKDGTTTLGTGTLSNGIATYSTSTLSVGTHSITAVYGGSSGSTSTVLSQVVSTTSLTTFTTLTANPAATSTYGQAVTLNATISPTNATGTVVFKDGATTLNSSPVAVTNGVATFSTSTLITGTHTLSAVYSGNSTYPGSTSSVVNYTVGGSTLVPSQTKLTASGGVANDRFGVSVSLSNDGNTALIGATEPYSGFGGPLGKAYIFVRAVNGSWSQQGTTLTASDGVAGDCFGSAVSLSGDGNTALINGGRPYIFVRTNGSWVQQGSALTAGGVAAYHEVTLSYDGNTALIGANVFVRSGTTWTQQQQLKASDGAAAAVDYFGGQVSLSSDGNTALISAFGKTITGTNGVGNYSQGAAYIFVRATNGSWSQQGSPLIASDGVAKDNFGRSVSLSSDGNTALIGANGKNSSQGAVYIFVRSGTTWTQQQQLKASDGLVNDWFGVSVSLSSNGNTALIGAHSKAIGTNSSQGAAYIFVRSGTTWTQQQLTASDGANGDYFGWSVSLSGDGKTSLIGAMGKNSFQGAAYIFASQTTITNTTTTVLSSSANPSTNGQNVTFTGNVTGAGGTPSGTVTFNDGTTTLGTGTLSNGVANFSTSTLSVGTHSITAVYSGDSTFSGSTSAVLSQVVSNGSSSSGLVYYPLSKPIRVLDTRAGATAKYNGSNGYSKIGAAQTVTYTLGGITYDGSSIPAAAQVVVATLAAVQPTGQGFLTIYPSTPDATYPTISSISYRDVGDTNTTSNTAYLNLGTGGMVNVYSLRTTDLVINILGYFAPAGTPDPNNLSSGLLFFPLPQPIRVLDTRANSPAYISGGSFSGGDTKNYTLAGITYNGYTIPTGAKALAANITAVAPLAPLGYFTIYPGPADINGTNRPLISSLNYRVTSNTTSNSYLTLDGNGVINVYSNNATDLVIDVSGYFAPVGTIDPNSSANTGLYYNPLPQPIRVLDTRVGSTALYSGGGQFSAGDTRSYNLTNITTGGYSIPAGARVLTSNTTVVGPTVQGFLTLYPGPVDTSGANRPIVSSLNYRLGTASATTSNPSHINVSSLGVANVYSLRATDVVIDISGYYVP